MLIYCFLISKTFCEIGQSSHSSRTHKVSSKPVVQKVAAVSNLARKFEQFQLEPETDDAEAPPVPPPMPPPSVPKPASKRSDRVVGILKKQGAPTNSVRRVQFDPLALLLDASLEGEIDLVKKVIDKVDLINLSLAFIIIIIILNVIAKICFRFLIQVLLMMKV